MGRLKSKLELLNAIHKVGSENKPQAKTSQGNVPPRAQNSAQVHFDTMPDTHFFKREQGDFEELMDFFPNNLELPSIKAESSLIIHREGEGFWNGTQEFVKKIEGLSLAAEQNPEWLNLRFPEELAFFDIETCGFSGVPLFLIGLCYVRDSKVYVTQFFARDYSEERSVLKCFWDFLPNFKMLVSYNGKAFDWPFIEERSYYWQLNPAYEPIHVDLLHYARKHWKKNLPNVKLQTLEKAFLKRHRVGDLPGSQIPAAYKEYVDNPSSPKTMEGAIHHNALDVISLMEIFLRTL